MDKVFVDLKERSYEIYIGKNLDIGSYVKNALKNKITNLMIVTNETIAPLYLEKVQKALEQKGFNVKRVILKDGEIYKTVDSYMQIMTALIENNFARDCALVALGGGVVGDMTGFAAATYQRGVAFVQIATTLLAMVDSSVGGKTAINHAKGKNMIGAFYQPKCVILDLEFLKTLNTREMSAGLSEIIKYGLIYDKNFFYYLYENKEKLLSYDDDILTYIVKRCCEIKAEVVSKDEKESNLRAILNFGHTFGHALESFTNYAHYLHGEAVGLGMLIACTLSYQLNALTLDELKEIKELLVASKIPISIDIDITPKDFMALMHHDKKVKSGAVNYILLSELGKSYVKSFDDSFITEFLESYLQN